MSEVNRNFTHADVVLVTHEANELSKWASDAETEEECRNMNDRCFRLLNLAARIKALLQPEA